MRRSFVCARALKGKLISQNWGTWATRRPVWNYIYSRAPLPTTITNEPPVIENNRCVRVMPSEDGTLATPSIYESVEHTSTSTRKERRRVAPSSTTTTREPAGARTASLASFRVIHILHAKLHSRSHPPRSRPRQRQPSLPLFSLFLSSVRLIRILVWFTRSAKL